MVSKSKKKNCINENCNEIAKYGLVNPETGMFEKHHCKIHKIIGEKGQPPKWEFRYPDMKIITVNRNVKLLDTKEEFIEKTKKDGKNAYLKLQCLLCLDIVESTSIDRLVQGRLGCSCNNKIPWSTRYMEFLEICKTRNVKLLDSKDEYIEKCEKDRKNVKLNLQCLKCNTIVKQTTIVNFVNQGTLGCSCNKIKWNKNLEKFINICKIRNVKLLNSKEEYIEKCEKDGINAKLNLQCLKCNTIVNTTTIRRFVHRDHLGCKCTKSKSEKCLGEILKDIFAEFEFKKIQPDWIKNQAGNNLELDYYNEELKLAFEYQGIQHEEYEPFFHRGDINNFYKQQEHDRIKKEICEKNGIKLICIPSKYDYTNPLEMCDFILDNL